MSVLSPIRLLAVVLLLPATALARPPVAAGVVVAGPILAGPDPAGEAPQPPRGPTDVAPVAPPPGPGAQSAPERPPAGCSSDGSVEPWLRCLGPEPSVEQVITWTLDEARTEEASLEDLIDRSRRRGALPVVRMRGRLVDGNEQDWDGARVAKGSGRDVEAAVELWLEWDLAELGGNAQEIQAMRDRRELRAWRQSLANRASTAWFDRRRLRLDELRFGASDAAAALERRLRVQELDATLDALTAGRWSRGLKAARALAPASPAPPPSPDPAP